MSKIQTLEAPRGRGRPKTIKGSPEEYGQAGPSVPRSPKVQLAVDPATNRMVAVGPAATPKPVDATPSASQPPAPAHIAVQTKTHSAPTLIGLKFPMIVEIVAQVAPEGDGIYDPKGGKVELVNKFGNKYWAKPIGTSNENANILFGLKDITDDQIAAAQQAVDFLQGKSAVPPLK